MSLDRVILAVMSAVFVFIAILPDNSHPAVSQHALAMFDAGFWALAVLFALLSLTPERRP